jgi:hypothetical protein
VLDKLHRESKSIDIAKLKKRFDSISQMIAGNEAMAEPALQRKKNKLYRSRSFNLLERNNLEVSPVKGLDHGSL